MNQRMQQLLSSSALVFLGLMARIGLLLSFEILAARHLGPASYGVFTLAFTVIVVLSSLPVLGLQNSLRRFISLNVEKQRSDVVSGLTIFGMVWPITWGLLLAVATTAFAKPISESMFSNVELGPVVALLAFVIPMWSLRRLSTVIFSGYKRTAFKVLVEDIAEPLLRLFAIAMVAALGFGVTELALGTLGSYALVGLLSAILVERTRRQVVGSHAGLKLPGRDLLRFSAPLVISEFAEVILAWVSILLLGALSAEYQVGLFRAVSQPPMLASAILTSFAFIYLPIATELYARNDYRGWQTTNNAIVRWTMSLAFPIGIVCLSVTKDVIVLLFGEEFRSGARAMQLLGAAYLFHAACGFTGLNLIVAGRTQIQMAGALAGLALNIALGVMWIPEYGASGAAAAVLVSVVARNGYNLFFMSRYLKIMPFDRRYWAILAVQLLGAGILVTAARLMDLSGIAAISFVGLLQFPTAIVIGWATGAYSYADVEWFREIWRRLYGVHER